VSETPDAVGAPPATEPAAAPLAGRSAVVITCSTRAATGVYPDRGGALVVETLRGWGASVPEAVVVADGPAVLLLTTGGTGLTPTDRTPESTRPFLTLEVPGIADAIRARGVAHGIPTAVLSRGLAGLAGRTLVVNLPGSTGGVKDALEVLAEVVPHALSQAQGGDH